MKISILTTGGLHDMKGIMNYVNEENHQFIINNKGNYTTDCYYLQFVYTPFMAFINNIKGRKVNSNVINTKKVINDDVIYNVATIKIGIGSFLLGALFRQMFTKSVIKQLIDQYPEIKHCDIIISHQLPSHYFAFRIKKMYGIPFITTWHGSDINIAPFKSKHIFQTTRIVLENADMNYFVSKRLMATSEAISIVAKKDYIYTGPSDSFFTPSLDDRKIAKESKGIEDSIIITFLGNLIPIKNVLLLPEIYRIVHDSLPNYSLKFWILGNGAQGEELKNKLTETGVDFTMFGKVAPESVPNYLMCTDILVLPSQNEGLPLSILEALQSGCHVVASNVGGIPECVIPVNCFSHGEDFVKNFAKRIVEIIEKKELPAALPSEFSWKFAIEKEIKQCCSIKYNNVKDTQS